MVRSVVIKLLSQRIGWTIFGQVLLDQSLFRHTVLISLKFFNIFTDLWEKRASSQNKNVQIMNPFLNQLISKRSCILDIPNNA